MTRTIPLLALGICLGSSTVLASTISPVYGFGSVTVNGLPAVAFGQGTKTGTALSYNPLAPGDAVGADSLAKNGFIWSVSWNVDPILTWSFTTTKSGPQTVKFSINILPDQFAYIFTSAGYTITGDKRGAGASVSDVIEKAYLPWPDLAANEVPVGQTTVKGSTKIKGSATVSNDNSGKGGIGDYVLMPQRTASTMGVVISFNATLGVNDRLGLNGQMDITPAPEPGPLSMVGIALAALAIAGIRRS